MVVVVEGAFVVVVVAGACVVEVVESTVDDVTVVVVVVDGSTDVEGVSEVDGSPLPSSPLPQPTTNNPATSARTLSLHGLASDRKPTVPCTALLSVVDAQIVETLRQKGITPGCHPHCPSRP